MMRRASAFAAGLVWRGGYAAAAAAMGLGGIEGAVRRPEQAAAEAILIGEGHACAEGYRGEAVLRYGQQAVDLRDFIGDGVV